MRGRKPTPTRLRLINGNPAKRPIRPEPTSTPIAGPPPELAPELVEVWAEIIEAAPPHVLTVADTLIIELTCRLLLQFRRSDPAPQVGIVAQLKGCLAELGMTPTSRARLSVAPPKPANPFDDLGA